MPASGWRSDYQKFAGGCATGSKLVAKPRLNRRVTKDSVFDHCYTPAYALDPLVPYLRPRWTVWECACGDGRMANVLRRHVADVYQTDIALGAEYDFLTHVPTTRIDAIITNPPYSQPLKGQFIRKIYESGLPFAILVQVDTLGLKSTQRLAEAHGFEWVFMDKRVNFHMPNKGYAGAGAHFASMWLCNHLIGRPVTFARITTRPDDQLDLPVFPENGKVIVA